MTRDVCAFVWARVGKERRRLMTCRRDGLLRRVLHAIRHEEVHAGFLQHALALFDVGAFEPHHDGDLHAQIACCFYDTARDHIATHDAAEDVHQHRAHRRVSQQNAKCIFDAFL
mgnify:CR=1 FL=1